MSRTQQECLCLQGGVHIRREPLRELPRLLHECEEIGTCQLREKRGKLLAPVGVAEFRRSVLVQDKQIAQRHLQKTDPRRTLCMRACSDGLRMRPYILNACRAP